MHNKIGYFQHFLYCTTFYFDVLNHSGHTQVENTGAVCLLLVYKVLSRINRDTVAGRGTALQSHAPRQLQTHACTHTRVHARNHRAAVVMRWPRVLKNTDVHQEADILFSWCPALFQRWQLKSACLSVDFRRKPSPACARVHTCPTRMRVSRKLCRQPVMVYNQYCIYDACWLFSPKKKSKIRRELWVNCQNN